MRIGLRLHAAFDMLLVALGLIGPFALGYSHLIWPTLYTVGAALFGLGLSAVTDYPAGLWRRLPFALHRLIEWSAPLPFILVPWLLFAEAGAMPWFMTALGIAIVLNASLAVQRQD